MPHMSSRPPTSHVSHDISQSSGRGDGDFVQTPHSFLHGLELNECHLITAHVTWRMSHLLQLTGN
jgi:hypothetical protein